MSNLFRVIAIDDSQTSLDFLKRTLDKDRFDLVATAHDGKDLISLFDQYHPHLVFLDIQMENSGLDALKQLMKQAPDAHVIMVTSVNDEEYIRQALEVGAAGFVIKPYDKETLTTILDAAIKFIAEGFNLSDKTAD
ncbi:response regulator transcription factor [Piscirickettsia litoralis]|uniref:Response regulatory domain-containing protein n=1 Tax=Piscirickettsia litoralis TaxID=1891921 RepID=A0ABX2ZXT8_9GAMM|nr:response regulator [Piscirickettsia litoralis]ODN41431.1 hypothetical protein BGC07_16850 [Piscirickettsia litoralis]